MIPLPLADTTPWTLWIPFVVFFIALAVAVVGFWLSRESDDPRDHAD